MANTGEIFVIQKYPEQFKTIKMGRENLGIPGDCGGVGSGGGGGRKKFLIPGYSVIFAGKARDPHPLRNFFPYTFTQNFL